MPSMGRISLHQSLVITHDKGTRKFVMSCDSPCELFASPNESALPSLRVTDQDYLNHLFQINANKYLFKE